MRKFIVAIFSLSSVMLHAQASSPAPTQVATNGPAPQIKRISTGVIPPKLIYKVDVVAVRLAPLACLTMTARSS